MYADAGRCSVEGGILTSDGSHSLATGTLAVVLAGGKGTRLGALTANECKPALPFAGFYRNIDFSLSNCVNSGIHRIGVATQYQDASLLQHLARVWSRPGRQAQGFVQAWRAEPRDSIVGYRGTADAVWQNWRRIEAQRPALVLILAGDHIYQMDYRPLLRHHLACNAELTVGCVQIPLASAPDFGVMSIDTSHRILRFAEKPRRPQCLPGRPDSALGSMGIYVFNPALLGRLLRADAMTHDSSHDFGRDLLPSLIDQARVFAYPFTPDAAVGAGYWRDVGTISAYWRAHMELLDGVSGLRLNDAAWPLRADERSLPVTPGRSGDLQAAGDGARSLLACGCATDGARLHRSVLCANVSVAPDSALSNAVVLPGAVIGHRCSLSDVVIGAGACVPDGTVIAPMKLDDGANAPGPVLVAGATDSRGNRTAHRVARNNSELLQEKLSC